MATSPCLTRNTLKDYLNGSADDQRLLAIESHLAECEVCEQTVLELERNPDTLLEGLRELNSDDSQANSNLADHPSVVQRAVDAARELQAAPMVPAGPLQKPGEIRAQQIGAYELLRPLGRGGMGLVMLARHSTLKKQVAIKILPSLIGDRPELVQRFQREIITAGQLSHPSIVHATDAGAEQGTHYLVMEYIDGLDLSRLARLNGPLSIADACELVRQTALGLSYAHAQGVVHRDIKPSNVMLDTAGRVKILDFGLAQLNLWEDAAVDLTTVGQLMGTLDYMAPEQAERVGPVDYRADLYALGATLFRLLTGRAPLAASPQMTLLEKVRLLGSQTAPLVSTLRDDCPSGLVRLIQQLLSRDPAARPASAAHIAESLLPFCEGHDVVSLLARCRERATSHASREESSLIPTARITPAPPTRPPRNNWIALAWLSPIAILAGIFITLETQKGQLVIESEVAGVKVNVLRDGKVYEQLQVKTGAESTRLFADKYSIEIDGASDELAIDQSSVEIRSRGTVVARVTRKTDAAATEQVAGPMSIPSLPNGGMKQYAPMYNGKTLEDWLEVLERELDAKTRGATLPAIIELGRAAEAPTRQRINRVLTKVINSSVGRVKWASDGIRTRPSGHENVHSMINALIAINGEEAGFSLLSDHCMLIDGQVTPSTFVILSSLRRESRESFKIDELAWQWLVSNGRFQSLNEQLAWLAFTYIEDRLFWEDEAFARALPTLIEKQPHLGLVALCELKIPGHLVRSYPFSELDQEIALRALRGFAAPDSSPQTVAWTAVRLAATKNFENHRRELVGLLAVRLQKLALDRARILAAVPRINPHLPANLAPTSSESINFRHSSSLANMPVEGAPPVAPEDQPVNSELASLLILAIRLQAVFELAEPLAAAAKIIFEEARPVALAGAAYFDLSQPPTSITNNEIESKLNQLKWPYDQDQLRQLPKPFNEFSPVAWRAHRLAQIFVPLLTVKLPLFNTQLYTSIVDFYADVSIAARDKNGDRKVSKAEDDSQSLMDLNGDDVVTKEELASSLQEGMMRGYVALRFGSFTCFLEGSDPPHYLTKDDQDAMANFTPAQFDEIDANHDGRVTLEELVAYGMKHPREDAPQSR